MRTIPDSNVILDIVQPRQAWTDWSIRQLKACYDEGDIVTNTIVYAEVSGQFSYHEEVTRVFKKLGIEFVDFPWDAAFLAGRAQLAYRRSGGLRDRVLADFLIGAHAASQGYRVLTRDKSRYRSYFPNIEIIAPDTHP